MSLSADEQHTLDLIKLGLTDSDPRLASLLHTFNRLASGEAMPIRERIWPGSRGASGCAGRRRQPHRRCRYPSQRRAARWAAPVLWLLITLSMISVALIMSRTGSPGKCEKQLAMVCAHTDPPRTLFQSTSVTTLPGWSR